MSAPVRYTIERRLRQSEFRWLILKEGTEVANARSYLQAFRIVNTLNANDELTPESLARLQMATKGESIR